MISWRAYWCFGAAVIVGVIAALLAVFAVPTLYSVLGLALLAAAVSAKARKVILFIDALDHLSAPARQHAARWVTAGIVTHLVWVLLVVLRPDLWLVWAVVLAALCAVSHLVAWALTFNLTRIQPRVEQQRQLEQAQQQAQQAQLLSPVGSSAGVVVVEDPRDPFVMARRAFQLRGYTWLTVMSWASIEDGIDVIGIAYRVQVPASAPNAKGGETRTKLSGADVEPLAIAFSNVLGIELETNWVHIKKEKGAGVYTISVCTVDALAKVYPYRDELEWKSIKDPCPIGHRIDGTVVTASLAQHWADTGQTRSGKTSLIHRKWARITISRNTVLWVGGVEKLFDTVAPWIEPYLGTDEELPIGAVAHGPQDTAEMLACALAVGRWRQTVPHRQREGFSTVIVQLDEASFFLVMNKIIAMYQGMGLNPTQLACNFVKGLASADFWLHLAAQRGTNGNWGDLGGDISANIGTQTVFRTGDPGEVGRATGDWKTPPPVHQGEFLYTTGFGQPVERLKAEYIQETDPSKPVLHDGASITDVAWSRRNFRRPLDARSERVARSVSEWYRNRPTKADDVYAYLAEVASSFVDMSDAQSAAYQEAFDETTEKIRARLAEAGLLAESADETEPAAEAAPLAAGINVTPMSRSKTLKVWVEEIIADADGPLNRGGIVAALTEAGYRRSGGEEVNPQQVTNVLRELLVAGRVARNDGDQTYTSTRISA